MKKYLLILILSTCVFFIGRFFEQLKVYFKKIKFKPNAAMLVTAAVILLLLGIIIGKGINPLQIVFNRIPSFGLGGANPHKDSRKFVICDFESEADIRKCNTGNATVQLSDDFVTTGKKCAKFTYTGGVQLSKISIERFFNQNPKFGNWQGYGYLLIDIYSINTNAENLKLKIRDARDKSFQRDLTIPSKRKYTAKIYLSELNASVDIRNIRQLNLFRWETKQDAYFYIDNIRLENDQQQEQVVPQERAVDEDVKAPQSQPNIAEVTARKKINYQLNADLEEWQVKKTNPHPASVIRFNAFVSNAFNLSRTLSPITGGIPFAKGQIKDTANLRVINPDGQEIPFQAKPVCHWPDDGSIKWLLFDLQQDIKPNTQDYVTVEYGPQVTAASFESGLKLNSDENFVTLVSGAIKEVINNKRFDFLGRVYLDLNSDGKFSEDEIVLEPADMYIQHNNKKFYASLDTQPGIEVENQGPLRIGLKRSGWFVADDGAKFCKYILRIEAFKDKPYLRVYHTFIYTGYPENKFYERYEGLKLPANETIQEIGVLIPLGQKKNATIGAEQGVSASDKTTLLYQENGDYYKITGADGKKIGDGKKADGWIDVSDSISGFSAIIRNFWQQYPKVFLYNAEGKSLVIKIWPKEAGELDLKTTENALGPDAIARGNAFGLGKTHELYFYFHKPITDYQQIDLLAKGLANPSYLRPDPKWLAATTVLGGLKEFTPKIFYDAEMSLYALFDWAYRQPGNFRWYGMIDFGDTLTWYRKEAYDKSYDVWGWHPEGRWGWLNCENAGTHSGVLLQYLRTGDLRYFEFGENLARHIMDVDTCHYNTIANDNRLKGIIDEEVSQVGSMHRHNGDHWGGRNEEADHTNIFGILLYYYLTGYERALEVAKESGSFFLKSPVTYTRHPDIAPQRAIANVLWGEVMLYESTGDEKYKKAADKWARIFVKGQDAEGYWQETYNPMDNSWTGEASTSFMAGYTLPALISYHIATQDDDVANAILKATDYLMAHEEYVPYYDVLSYSYWLTGDTKYQAFLESYLDKFCRWCDRGKEGDDLHRGMLFDKLTYGRPNNFLYSVPFAFGALSHRPKAQAQYAQPQIPVPTLENAAFSAAVVSSAVKVFPDSRDLLSTANRKIELSAARNEYESTQVVLYDTKRKVVDISVQWADLVNRANGAKIAKENIECRLVEYVKTKKPDYQVERVGFWPDPLSENRSFELNPGTLQPLWITVYVPKDAQVGEYEGTVVITAAGKPLFSIPFQLRVFNFTLPVNPTYKTAFDLYPGRMKVVYPRRYEESQNSYDERMNSLVDKYYDAMLKFKISPIFNFDYLQNNFDKKVEDYLSEGMTVFGIGKYGGSFDNNWPKSKDEMGALSGYYHEFATHLRKMGWLQRAYVYTYDEPKFGDERVAEACEMIHRADSSLKNMVCLAEMQNLSDYEDWAKDIDIFTIRNFGFDYDLAKAYIAAGKELWIYVSGPNPPYPNLAIDFPAMAYRIIPWMSYKYNVTGLLYWSVNYWNGDPWKNPMNTKWGHNGNGFLFYPGLDGLVPSLRLYVLRDGIEDYEYMRILEAKIAEAKDKGAAQEGLLKNAEGLLIIEPQIVNSMAAYTKTPSLIENKRLKIAEMIEKLSGIIIPTAETVEAIQPVTIVENFSRMVSPQSGMTFGSNNEFTFELYGSGTFEIDGKSGYAWQRSPRYNDIALIRSSKPLPKKYKISVMLGEIDYGLENIAKLKNDTKYTEGPLNENGVYLLAISDEEPSGHHTNDWWHKHRKVCVDIDNNIWGTGMPNPVFMVAFDKNNNMMALNGQENKWQRKWEKAITYDPKSWYKVEIEKTDTEYRLCVYDDSGRLLKGGSVPIKDVWNEGNPDYLVIGDPHENYYQGSMRIKSISMTLEDK